MSELAPIRARCDADGVLVFADEPLAGLQRACGGELPGMIAVPQLLALIADCRSAQVSASRQLWARDGENEVRFWAEATPEGEGYAITVAGWEAQPSPMPQRLFDSRQSAAIARAGASAVLRLDPEQRIVSVIGESSELAPFAERARALIGQPWRHLVTAEHGEAVRLSGAQRWWSARLHTLTGRMGAVTGHDLFIAPIRERDALAAANSAQEAAELALTLERDLAPALAGPIAEAIANADRIGGRLLGPLDDTYAQYGQDILAAGQHLERLTGELGGDGIMHDRAPQMALLDLGEVASAAAAILQPLAVERGIRLTAELGGEPVSAWADRTAVTQILLNLIGNALRYAPRGSAVSISTMRDESGALVRVDDSGPGIPADQREQVFARYERLGRSKDGGSGLGLAISRRLARDMGGDITVEGREPNGSRFTLSLNAEAPPA